MWEDVHEAIEKIFLKDQIGLVLSTLSDRERTVIVLRHLQGMTLKECGQYIGVCPERIRQSESKAFRKLRSPPRCNALSDFIHFPPEKTEPLKEPKKSVPATTIYPIFKEANEYARRLKMTMRQKKQEERKRAMDRAFEADLERCRKFWADFEEKKRTEELENQKSFDVWYKNNVLN